MIPVILHLRLSLEQLTEAARGLERAGMRGGPAWRGVLRQLRRYAAELRRVVAATRSTP